MLKPKFEGIQRDDSFELDSTAPKNHFDVVVARSHNTSYVLNSERFNNKLSLITDYFNKRDQTMDVM